ncbi:hypothetical protein LTR85_002264 [Meristemomyces frigidus]|nr:hypothetical protein LTR85_002264 [Meristemomyces frigidus]
MRKLTLHPQIRATLLPQTRITPPSRRSIHYVPPLTYDDSFRKQGIPGLLSPDGFRIAWTDYQASMVQKLNELTAGEPYEDAHVKQLALQFARDPTAASLFNHASMAHNNHFFFNSLSTSPMKIDRIPTLQQSLSNTYGSMETLQGAFLDTAAAMFGPGFVWLVWARSLDNPTSGVQRRGAWRILTTYLAGTPYPEAGYRQQGLDMNNNSAASYNAYTNGQPTNYVGAFGSWSQSGREQAKLPPGGTNVMPVLCVNTWEHVWLRDYGMNGKRRFLKDWWEAVDWSQVESLAPMEAKQPLEFQRA